MRILAFALVLFTPLVAEAEKENIPSEEQLRLIQNCCVVPNVKQESSPLGELKRDVWFRKIIKDKRVLITAIDPNPKYGGLYFGRQEKGKGLGHNKEWTFHYRHEGDINEIIERFLPYSPPTR